MKTIPVFILIITLISLIIFSILSVIQQKNVEHQKQDSPTYTKEYIFEKMRYCKEEKNMSNTCYKNTANNFLNSFSLKNILDVFEKYETTPELYDRCHETLHYLGRMEYQRVKNVRQVMTQCSTVCLAGCYHGAIEQYLIDKNIPINNGAESIEIELPRICGSKKDYEQEEIYNQCIHGVGHAIMFLTEGEVPQSLAICDNLPDVPLCYTGVFMQNTNGSTDSDHPSKYIKQGDPMYPCNILDDKYKEMCYGIQVAHFFKLTNFNWERTANLCDQVPSNYQNVCFTTMGSHQVGYISDMEVLKNNCISLPKRSHQVGCTQGTTRHLIIRYSGNVHRSIEFCQIVPIDFKQNCFREIGLSLRDWVKDDEEIRMLCSRISEKEYLHWCQNPDVSQQYGQFW